MNSRPLALSLIVAAASLANGQTTEFYHCPDTSNQQLTYRWGDHAEKHEGVYLRGTAYLSWQLKQAAITNAVGTVSSSSRGVIYHEGFPGCGGSEGLSPRSGCDVGQVDVGLSGTQGVGLLANGNCLGSSSLAIPVLPSCFPSICNHQFPREASTTVCADFADCLATSSLRLGLTLGSADVWGYPPGNVPFTFHDTAYAIAADIDAFQGKAAYAWTATVAGSPSAPPFFEIYWDIEGLAEVYSCGTSASTLPTLAAYYNVRHVGIEVLFKYTNSSGTTTHRGVAGSVQNADGSFTLKRLGLAAGVTPTWNGNEYSLSGTFNAPSGTGTVSVIGTHRTFDRPGDLNADNYTNHYDRLAIAALDGATLSSSNYDAQADVNLDGVIDENDILTLQRNPAAYNCLGDYDGNLELDNDDFIAFINDYFSGNVLADIGQAAGLPGADGLFNNNDFIAFNDFYFAWDYGCH